MLPMSSYHCTAPFPEHFPVEFSVSYWQNSPVQTMLRTDPRYKTQFLVMYTHSQPPHWFMSRPLLGYSSNPSGTAMVTVVLGGWFHNFPGACADCDYFPELVLPNKLLEFYHSDRARRVNVKWLKPEATLVCTSAFRTWDWDQILTTLHLLFSHAAKPGCLFSNGQGSLSALRGLEALFKRIWSSLQRQYEWKSTGVSVPSSSVCLGNSCSSSRRKYVTAAPDSKFLVFQSDEKQKMNAGKHFNILHYKV